MSGDKKTIDEPLGQNDQSADERIEALVKAICEEMDTSTPEELERLYVAIALMELKQDE